MFDWEQLWSFGRYCLRLSTDEFWDLTPREFEALQSRYQDEQDWLNYRAALVSSVIASGLTGKEFKPEEFMPVKVGREQTPDEMFQLIKILNMTLGGKVVERKHG